MNRGGTEGRSSTLSLGQIMAMIGAVGGACGLVATVNSIKGGSGEVQFVVAWILCYALYLGFILLLVARYFSRTQVLLLLASAGILSALLIQVVTTSKGEWALGAMLVFPVLPIALGLVMIRMRSSTQDDDEIAAEETETLSTLVKNKRGRGLVPQAGPDPSLVEGIEREQERRFWISGALAVLALVLVVGYAWRHSNFMRLSSEHSKLESRYSEEALAFREAIDEAEAQLEKEPSDELRAKVADLKHRLEESNRKADWHAKKSTEYGERW